MANLFASCIPSNTIPEKYVCPPEKRAGNAKKADIPVIDLHDEGNSDAIMKASQDFGIFMVINHGIPIEQMNKAMEVFDEFFKLPSEEKSKYPMESDTKKVCRAYTSTFDYDTEEFHNWRDCLTAECTPLDECIKFWPQNPQNFKSVIGEYTRGVKELRLRLLEQISIGLGLERDHLTGELSKGVALTVNHYPPSPNPDLTLGLHEHEDAAAVITIMQATDVPAFQFLKDDQWFTVETRPDAFLVFMGSQIEVISNGKLKAVRHRVTSTSMSRYSVVFFIYPSPECVVEPAKAILEAENTPSHYKSFKFKDFFDIYIGPKSEGIEVDQHAKNLQINHTPSG